MADTKAYVPYSFFSAESGDRISRATCRGKCGELAFCLRLAVRAESRGNGVPKGPAVDQHMPMSTMAAGNKQGKSEAYLKNSLHNHFLGVRKIKNPV